MFAERFDAVMNIAEITNSRLARTIHMNPSYIGRLRSGERPLPQKQNYLPSICGYLARHITKSYQFNALQKLLGIEKPINTSDEIAAALEAWLLEETQTPTSAANKLLTVFSSLDAAPKIKPEKAATIPSRENNNTFFGNAGKRKAVEHFFHMILQEKKPQTLLLFSDENMDWLYEDATFAGRWTQLFIQVIAKGNRVKIIHTLSRDINEMIEAVSKWLPIYMTGMVEPYYYPRLRDGVFRRTLFIAPHTAAIASSSIQQDTDGMLNLLLTDADAVAALTLEFERYCAICRPLMHIYMPQTTDTLNAVYHKLNESDVPACLCVMTPPLFAMPEDLIRELAAEKENTSLIDLWKKDRNTFESRIASQKLTVILPPTEQMTAKSELTCFSENSTMASNGIRYTASQYLRHLDHLKQMAKHYDNLQVKYKSDLPDNMIVYVKDGQRLIIIKSDQPQTAFEIDERNMISAFWDYLDI